MSQFEGANLLDRTEMSHNLRGSLQRAITYAFEQSHRQVTLEHLLLALSDDREAAVILESSAIDVSALMTDVSAYLGRLDDRIRSGQPQQPELGGDVQHIIQSAGAAAQKSKRRAVSSALVLAAIVGDGRSPSAQMLRNHGLTFENAIAALKQANARAATSPAPQASPGQPAPVQPSAAPPASPPPASPAQLDAPGAAGPHAATSAPTPGSALAASTAAATNAGAARLQNMQAAHEIIAGARERIAAARGSIANRTAEPDLATSQPDQTPNSPPPAKQPSPPVPPTVPAEPPAYRDQPDSPAPPPSLSGEASKMPPSLHADAARPTPPAPPKPLERAQSAPPKSPQPPLMQPPPPSGRPSQPATAEAQDQTGLGAQVAQATKSAEKPTLSPPPPPTLTPPPKFDPAPRPSDSVPPAPPPPNRTKASGLPLPQGPRVDAPPSPVVPSPPRSQHVAAPPSVAEARPAPDQPAPPHLPGRPAVQPPMPARQPNSESALGAQQPVYGQPPPGRPTEPATGLPQYGQIAPPSPPAYAPPPPAQAAMHAGQPVPDVTPIETETLAEDVPTKMRVGVPQTVEIRAPRARLEAWSGGNPDPRFRDDQIITKAMVMRLRAPEGGFTVETASPETQWSEGYMGPLSDDVVSWRWIVTPLERGRMPLQLSVSTRIVGRDGLAAARALPEQLVAVRVAPNYGRIVSRLVIGVALVMTGLVLGYFADGLFGIGSSILAQR